MTWLPFDLHPEYPPDGIPRERLLARYGPRMDDFLRSRFAETRLAYNPPPDVVPNSRAALRLTELARDRGLHDRMHDRLMDAFWAEGRNLGDHDVLRDVAREVGLVDDEVESVLAGDGYLDRVEASTREAQGLGITGIPAWILEGRLLLLGAQPREVFEQAVGQLAAA